MQETTPRYINHYPLSQIMIRFFIGLMSGSIGTLILAILMLATWSIIGEYLVSNNSNEVVELTVSEAGINPIFAVIVGIAIFFTTMTSNIIYSLLIPLVDPKYQAKQLGLSNVFTGGLVIAAIMIPVYIMSSISLSEIGVGIAGMLHGVLFSIYTILALEIVNKNNYLVVSLIGVILGVALFTFFEIMLVTGSDSNVPVAILLSYPLLMGCMSMSNTLIEGMYGWFYKTYGTDTLAN